MKNSVIRKKLISILLLATMSTSILTACGADDDVPAADIPTTAVTVSPISKGDKKEDASSAPSTTAPAEKPASSESGSKTQSSTKKPSGGTTKAPAKTSTKATTKKPNRVNNAKTSSELANVSPKQAAAATYDTEITIKETSQTAIDPDVYVHVKYENFDYHIKKVWKNFQEIDQVKIEAKYLNEYLNYCCLPMKDTFYEINCNGYDAQYSYDATKQYVFLKVNWSYYVNATQFSACQNMAKSVVLGATGSTIEKIRYVHDYIASHTTYKENVDGIYNCLINGKSDCDGYTAAFKLCMDLLGIESKAYCTSDHIFNLVKYNGKWYAVDCTWDDQDAYGMVIATYFMRGNAMYKNFPILVNLPLANGKLDCDRSIYVANDTKFRSACGLKPNQTYKPDPDGVTIHVYEDGTYLGYFTLS